MVCDKPVAVNVVALELCTTVPPPRGSPLLYVVPSTGFPLSVAEVLTTTKYSSAVVAVNEPSIDDPVMFDKVKPVG